VQGFQVVISGLVTLQLLCTAAMTGIIWYVQCVHYPSFRWIDRNHWGAFHRRHTGMTGAIVAPLMLGEVASAALLYVQSDFWRTHPLTLGAGFFLGLIWLSTLLVQIPLHHRLEKTRESAALERLIRTNWIRTAAWTGRLFCLLAVAGSER
jgi:hypothetical protein